jgi:tetratricopeptide (TPR) repeat protein
MEERFAGNAGLPQAAYEIGRKYKDVKQTDKAFQVYQSVIKKWKDTEWAIHSQGDIIHSHLERSDDKAANAAVDTLLTDFANHKDITGMIYNLGKHYRNLKRPDIALRLHQYNVEHYAKDVQGMYSQVEVIKSAIGQGDDAGSEKEFARLVQLFAGQATLPKEVYQVGIAYSKANKPEQARRYYQYVVDHWPDSDAAVRAQVAILDKESPPGANTTVEEAFGRLIAAFS